jgi:HSP20 family protein
MILFDPIDAVLSFQQALDAFRDSRWLESGTAGGGSYPPVNVFRKGEDFVAIAELPGVAKQNIDVQVKGNAIRIAGSKVLAYTQKASVHRRERLAGRFDRVIALPVEIDSERVRAECRDGILALYLPVAEKDKPKSIQVS